MSDVHEKTSYFKSPAWLMRLHFFVCLVRLLGNEIFKLHVHYLYFKTVILGPTVRDIMSFHSLAMHAGPV